MDNLVGFVLLILVIVGAIFVGNVLREEYGVKMIWATDYRDAGGVCMVNSSIAIGGVPDTNIYYSSNASICKRIKRGGVVSLEISSSKELDGYIYREIKKIR